MASSDVRDREERGLSREVPFGAWAAGPDGMHIHLHLGEASNREKRRPWLTGAIGIVAVAFAFGAGQFSASRPASRTADLEMPADLALMRRMGPMPSPLQTSPAPTATAAQLPALPQLPPLLQQQLAQPPRVVSPSPAPVLAGTPGTPSRNAFGLER